MPIRSIVFLSGGSSATSALKRIGRLTPISRPVSIQRFTISICLIKRTAYILLNDPAYDQQTKTMFNIKPLHQ
jgi:hypothetical protein